MDRPDRPDRQTRKPDAPSEGPRVDPKDPVEEASYESFPASDPPSFTGSRAAPPSDKPPADPVKGSDTAPERQPKAAKSKR